MTPGDVTKITRSIAGLANELRMLRMALNKLIEQVAIVAGKE